MCKIFQVWRWEKNDGIYIKKLIKVFNTRWWVFQLETSDNSKLNSQSKVDFIRCKKKLPKKKTNLISRCCECVLIRNTSYTSSARVSPINIIKIGQFARLINDLKKWEWSVNILLGSQKLKNDFRHDLNILGKVGWMAGFRWFFGNFGHLVYQKRLSSDVRR